LLLSRASDLIPASKHSKREVPSASAHYWDTKTRTLLSTKDSNGGPEDDAAAAGAAHLSLDGGAKTCGSWNGGGTHDRMAPFLEHASTSSVIPSAV